MPDLSQACSYSSVPSAIFEGSTTCIVEFNEQMRSFFDVNYECEEPYGEWTEWETFDAQTESRLRYKKDTISSASFVCDYMDRDLRLIQTTTQTPLPTQAPIPQNWPNAQVPGQPVNYPPGTQFGSDGFKGKSMPNCAPIIMFVTSLLLVPTTERWTKVIFKTSKEKTIKLTQSKHRLIIMEVRLGA